MIWDAILVTVGSFIAIATSAESSYGLRFSVSSRDDNRKTELLRGRETVAFVFVDARLRSGQ